MDNEALHELVQMHRYMRPAYSQAEREFCAAYVDCLPGVTVDKAGNRIGIIGEAPKVLWSSHTDTVHKQEGTQKLDYGDGYLTTAPAELGGCLGADCTVGVWLMRRMYLASVPGLYIWHAAEEVGGVGSSYIADETPEILSGISYAIAFDRMGTDSVITHQWSGRSASNEFALALATKLGPDWRPDSRGTFTDTANYVALIPECTNISVGYYGQHSQKEALDVEHALTLLDIMLQLEVDDLPVMREPQDEWRNPFSAADPVRPATVLRFPNPLADLVELLQDRPHELAELLLDYGFTAAGLEDELDSFVAGRKPRVGVYTG